MPGLESMRRRLSSIAKPTSGPTSPPPHSHPDNRLLEPDFFNTDAEDLTWFHKVNLAVRHQMAKLPVSHDYMHIQRVTVSAYTLFQHEKHQPLTGEVDSRTIVVAAMVHALGDILYAEDLAGCKVFGPRLADTVDTVQHVQHDLIFDFLRALDCPPDVAGPAALIASLVSFNHEVGGKEKVRDHCEAYPALRFVQDADRLDELGCVGIARMIAGEKKTILEVVERMDKRLAHYVGLMKTKSGRKEAEKRWAQMLEFKEGLLAQTDCSGGLKVEGHRRSV